VERNTTFKHGDNGTFEVNLQVVRRMGWFSVSCSVCKENLFQQGGYLYLDNVRFDYVIKECAEQHCHLVRADPAPSPHV
jgi:hypothetical protein